MPVRRSAAPSAAGGCRMCAVSCERVVYPAGCIASGCLRCYSYLQGGRTYFGCVEGVFRVEIDRALFDELEAQRGGFGGLRAAREPLPVCRTAVDRTFEHRPHGDCVNPGFAPPGA
ncbi:MAG: hypothetical protein AB1416_11720, partial [Actinomycetota bacterium]